MISLKTAPCGVVKSYISQVDQVVLKRGDPRKKENPKLSTMSAPTPHHINIRSRSRPHRTKTLQPRISVPIDLGSRRLTCQPREWHLRLALPWDDPQLAGSTRRGMRPRECLCQLSSRGCFPEPQPWLG